MAEIKVLNTTPVQKVIIVTGGYGYLGKSICASLCQNGAIVYVAGRNKLKFKKVFLNELKKYRNNLIFLPCDINDSESIKECFKNVYEKEGRIDGLINNAFFVIGQSPYNMTRDDFNSTLNACLTSVFEMIKESLKFLNNGGRIVNVSSMYGIVAPDFRVYKASPNSINPPHYGAAKAGIIQLSKYYASLLGDRQICVNTVSPGPFPNDKVQSDIAFIRELERRTLLGKIGLPEELAGIFTFLLSDAARFITGQNFIIDGGWSVR